MQRVDRNVGLALALLALAVLGSAQSFPVVPGQKLGAGFLPMLVGAGLLACGVGLVLRSRRAPAGVSGGAGAAGWVGLPIAPALVAIGVVVAYIVAADRIGFLLLTPPLLVALFHALRVAWVPALAWALGGTLLVHLAFYKLLRVPLPWGLLRPFY